MSGQVVCDHELGFDNDEFCFWYEHSVSDAISTGDRIGLLWAVGFVRKGRLNAHCPDCGQRIDWDAIKAQLGIG